jgi:hypothetical protein
MQWFPNCIYWCPLGLTKTSSKPSPTFLNFVCVREYKQHLLQFFISKINAFKVLSIIFVKVF